MSTKYFWKKCGYKLLLCVAAISVACSCLYAAALHRAERVSHYRSFYFLVSEREHVEAGAAFAQLDGGAGYLLAHEKEEYVALSVYFSEREGIAVRERLQSNGQETSLLCKKVEQLCFKGTDKKNSALYRNALRVFEGYMSVLSECISRLEKGMTQESCKRILTLLKRQFSHAEGAYAEYTAFSQTCAESAEQLSTLCESVVYLKDLRYLLCWQAEKYVELCQAFSI